MMARPAVEDIRSLEFVFAGRAGKSVLRHRRGARSSPRRCGRCCLLRHGRNGDSLRGFLRRKEAVVETLGPGEFFGADCILEQAVRLCSAVTLDRCTLMRIESPI